MRVRILLKMQFVSDYRQVGGFSSGIPISFTNKTDHLDITEILSKVAINNINQSTNQLIFVIILGFPLCSNIYSINTLKYALQEKIEDS